MSKSSGVANSVTRVGSVELKSPVMNASGTAGHGTELHRYVDLSSLGAFVVKSLAPFEWAGNASPRLSPTTGGMLNAVGLQGPGIEYWITHDLPKLLDVGANIVVSIWGFGVDDYAQAAQMLRPVAHQLSALEINLSCPNTKSATDSSARHAIFAHEPQLVEEIVKASNIDGVPAWAKLSPNTHLVIEGARAAQRGGAQAPAERVAAFLEGWRAHRLGVFRAGYGALHDLVLGAWHGADWIVEGGLAAGERVIVEGMQKARPGQRVTVAPATPPAG